MYWGRVICRLFCYTIITWYWWCFILKIWVVHCAIIEGRVSKIQGRNQNFFRAGEVLWNQGALINISLKNKRKKDPAGKNWEFFLLDTLKTISWIENSTQRWIKPGPFFPKSGHFFDFQKRAEEASPPPLVARLKSSTRIYIIYNLHLIILHLIFLIHLIYSVQYKNGCLSTSDLFHMFTQSIKLYTLWRHKPSY